MSILVFIFTWNVVSPFTKRNTTPYYNIVFLMDLKKKFPNIEEYHVTIIKRKEDNGE